MNPIVYLTVELRNRDLESRLLIAAHLLKRGFSVIVGQQWALWDNIDTLPKGCYLFKSANPIQAKAIAKCKEAGHLVVSADEEALAYGASDAFNVSVCAEAIAESDLFLAQSNLQKDTLETKYGAAPGKIKVAGNSRADMLSFPVVFRDQAETIRKQFEPFYLFNTNYSIINSPFDKPVVIGDDSNTVRQSLQSWQTRNRDELLALYKWCLANTTKNIVIRPHPVEWTPYWAPPDALKHRVSVVENSSPIPWIMASECVLHTNCTTGLEAALLNVPTINLSPDPENSFSRRYIMSNVCPTVESFEEAAMMLAQSRVPASNLSGTFSVAAHGGDNTAAAIETLFFANSITASAPNEMFSGTITWAKRKRTEVQKLKCTVGLEEVTKMCESIFPLANVTNLRMMKEMDDSIFLMAV